MEVIFLPKKPKKIQAHSHRQVNSGTVVYCIDRRVNVGGIAKAMKRQRFPEDLVLAIKSSYGHESAGNKIDLGDPIIAQSLVLGIGPGHPGKIVSVFGHNGKCGGMNAQHELHKLEVQMKAESRKGNKAKADLIRKRIEKLKKDPILGWVSSDMNKFNGLISVLRKKTGSQREFLSFVNSEKFRLILEEFNVMVQLGKLIKRKDFRAYRKTALKDGRGKIDLVGGIYSPKEHISLKGKAYTATGSVSFDFPEMYSVLGKETVEELLSSMNLKHSKGNPIVDYK